MIKKASFLLLTSLCLVMIGNSTHAQGLQNNAEPTQLPPVIRDLMPEAEILPDVQMHPRTHPEKILFTQLKLSKQTPDLDAYSKASRRVEAAQKIDKAAIVISEYNRINNSYSLHDQNATIAVQTQLKVDEYSSLQNLIVFDELDETTFFQFKIYNDAVGIVPENIAQFSKLALSKPRAERMFASLDGDQDVVAEFILKPVYADRDEPFMVNDQSVWLMFARIAEMRLWSDSNPERAQLLWFHRANWYRPKDNSDIDDLFVKETNG